MWKHWQAFEIIWKHLRAFESIWKHWGEFESIWKHVQEFEVFKKHLEAFESKVYNDTKFVFRDDTILPTSGIALCVSQELSGLGGNVLYFKNTLVKN